MEEIQRLLFECGIVPVVAINDPKHARPLAKALLGGGITAMEVTFRTDFALKSIEEITSKMPEMPEILVGAGTVTTGEMARNAVRAGARFIVSPGLNPSVVKWCLQNGVPVLPGVSTPTEIERAMSLGLTYLKFFPAEASGGKEMLSALYAPYRDIRFMPTGGICLENMKAYLSLPNVFACGGSWICRPELIDAENFGEIERLSSETVAAMHGFELLHVGINSKDEKEAKRTAASFENLFLQEKRDAPGSIFVGGIAEVLKKPFLGKNGHIGISTNNFDRAAAYLKRKGCSLSEEHCTPGVNAYLCEEIGGFAVHIRQK